MHKTIIINKGFNTIEITKKANLIHNNKYDYSLTEYIAYNKKIKIICNLHGVFEQTPERHINRKYGCPNCSTNKKITQEEFIEKANLIHNNKYDYSLCNYKNSKTKISIICKEHGVFEQIASSHTHQKTGCPVCSKKHKYTNIEFIEKANLIHNNVYCYSKINYINNYTKVCIICKNHGDFEQTPSNHLSGKGCEICKTSKNENLISLYLNKYNITYHRQHKFNDCKYKRLLPFDFYLPKLNMCIEFQGKQHYEPIKFFGGYNGFIEQQKRDKIKNDYCANNNIKLLIIKYCDSVDEILSKMIIV
jgi:hypothetical protein